MKNFLVTLAVFFLLVSGAVAFAQSGADGTIIRRRDLTGGSSILPATLQTTVRDMDFYVCAHNNPDAGGGTPNPCTVVGNDNNACTTQVQACNTIQGAVDKVPRAFRHRVMVHVGPGNYRGALVSNFHPEISSDAGVVNASAQASWFIIQGTVALATDLSDAGTGDFSPTGTVTSATEMTHGANADTVRATMTDTTKAWTNGALRGKLIEMTVGSAVTSYPIVDNTGTTITIAGPWNSGSLGGSAAFILGGLLPVGGSSTYRILTQASNINVAVRYSGIGATTFEGFGGASALDQKAGLYFWNHSLSRGTSPYFGVDKMRFSGTDITNASIFVGDGSIAVTRSRFENDVGNGQVFVQGGGSGAELIGNYHVINSNASSRFFVNGSSSTWRQVFLTQQVFDGCGSTCIQFNASGRFVVALSDFRVGTSSIWGPISAGSGELSVNDNFIDCVAPSSRVAINMASTTPSKSLLSGAFQANVISNCNAVFSMSGSGYISSAQNRNSGTGNNIVYRLTNGAIVEADRWDTLSDGGLIAHDTIIGNDGGTGTDVVIDTDKSYSFSQINSLSPDGGVLLKSVFDLRSGVLVRQAPQ
jgi:hypothetical protein